MQYKFKAQFFKVLAHPLRIRILDALRGGRVRLGVEQSTLSQQLAILRAQGFVSTQRQGTTVRYEIQDPAIWTLLDSALEIFNNQLINVQTVLEDMRREA